MLGISRLHNAIRNYDWGSTTALAELLGHAPTGRPEAELWMGAHPEAPSKVRLGGELVSLAELVPELPFLFKVLAVERPLSIQVHPNREQATLGFRREESSDTPREKRNYRDAQPKTEILVALGEFWLLRGFRAVPEVLELSRRLDLAPLLPEVSSSGEDRQVRDLFRAWMELDPTRVREAVAALGRRSEAAEPDVVRWIRRLEEAHAGDRGVLAPLFLHLLRLEPDEAIATGPGVVHAYLQGLGVELMTNSDNVVRCGLTTKHQDVEELTRILAFRPDPPRILVPEGATPGDRRFEVPGTDLVLAVLDLEPERWIERGGPRGVEILFCSEGTATLAPAAGETFELSRGDSLLLPASAGTYRLQGTGRLFRAGIR